MEKRKFFLNNPSSDIIRVTELNVSVPPGISNLFELNSELSYDQILYSTEKGTLRAAMDNGLCYPVPDPIAQKSFSTDVLLRKPLQVQVHSSRARFTSVKNQESEVFSAAEMTSLFDDEIKSARELEEEIKLVNDNTEKVEATIKQANIPEKPIENRYAQALTNTIEVQQKIKNDLSMGYETCEGVTANNTQCKRRAKTGKRFCGLHLAPLKFRK